MPSRTLIVHTVKSSLGSMLSASMPWTSRFWSTENSGSKNVRARIWQYESHCTAAGVHGEPTSASPATTSRPPTTGSPSGAGSVSWTTTSGAGLPSAVVSVEPSVVSSVEPSVVSSGSVASVVASGVVPSSGVVSSPPAVVVGAAPATVGGAPSDVGVVASPPLTAASSFLSEQAAATSPRLSTTAPALVHRCRFADRAVRTCPPCVVIGRPRSVRRTER